MAIFALYHRDFLDGVRHLRAGIGELGDHLDVATEDNHPDAVIKTKFAKEIPGGAFYQREVVARGARDIE